MAQFFTDFSDTPLGSLRDNSADWSTAWAGGNYFVVTSEAGALGGRYVDTNPGDALDNTILWDGPGGPGSTWGDIEVLTKVRLGSNTSYMGPVICAPGGTGAANSDGYFANIFNASFFQIREMNNGSDIHLGDVSKSFSLNTWYWIRFQKRGTTLRARAWQDGSAEPGTWDVSVTDSSFGGGYPGFFISVTAPQDFDVLGVGTGADSAPSEAPVVSVDVTVNAVVGEATADAPAPAVSAPDNVTVTGVVATASADALAPTVTTTKSATVTGVVGEATAAALAPEVATTASTTIAGEVGEASADAVAPAVSTTSSASVAPPVAEATAQASPPLVSTGTAVVISAPAALATADAPWPTVLATSPVSITAPVAEGTADALAPAVSTTFGVEVGVPVAEATADALSPVVTIQRVLVVTPPVAEATAVAVAPGIEIFVPSYDQAITFLRGSLEEELVLGSFIHEVVLDRSGFATSEA